MGTRYTACLWALCAAGATLVLEGNADCGIVPMTEWAGEAIQRSTKLPSPVGVVIVQHTVTPGAHNDEGCVRLLKAIRNYHIKTMLFDDIGENFLVCENGKVYEGAGWGLVGAHTPGYNNRSIGLTFIGTFEDSIPNQDAMSARQQLLKCGESAGHLSADYKLVGHRQVHPTTASPGDALQKEIEHWPHWTSQP